MRSCSGNSRTTLVALSAAAAVSFLTGTAVAADKDHNFVFTAYSNGRGGQELLSGDVTGATKALRYIPPLALSASSVTNRNRCVALSLTRQWDAARNACDQAVRDARIEKAMMPSYQYSARKDQNESLAIALSNRAVLHWLSSDAAAAASDLKRAEELAPKSAIVRRNQAALEFSHTAVAQVPVAPGTP